MFERHTALRQELNQVKRFVHTVKTHRDRMSQSDSTASDADARQQISDDDILQHVSVAFEDIPEDMHETVRVVLMRPADDTSLRARVVDVAANVAGGGWGDIEEVTGRLAYLHMLSTLSIHSPYTYRVDDKTIRGSRPTPDKLRRLYAGGCRATVNLCREMPQGDHDLIRDAGLAGQMATTHIQITDNTPPTPADVDKLIACLKNSDGTVYVHCEAGVGRTGVMVACYRMAQGWTLANALLEAKQFGCAMPDQLAFIEDRASGAATLLTSAALQPSDEVLRQTAAMNKDPMGLDRALTS
jgi:protein-tyrosine phosphatase